MSLPSSINSSASQALLPHNQESAPAQPLPEEILLVRPEPEEETLLVDVDDAVSEEGNVESVVENATADADPALAVAYGACLKVPYPKVLIDMVTPVPVGEDILLLVLRHACLTGFEHSFKHGRKRRYLDNLHSHAFNDDGILNQ